MSDVDRNSPPKAHEAIHIDTTLQIEHFKIKRRSDKIKDALRAYPFVSTSSYAQHEFNRTVIRDLAFIHGKLAECNTVGELLDAIIRSFPHGGNRRSRCEELVSGMLDSKPVSLRTDCEMVWLRGHLELLITQAHVNWKREVTYQFPGTACWRADVKPYIAPNGKVVFMLNNCRRGKIKCRVHRFFEENHERFVRVANAARADSNASDQLKTIAAQIDAAITDPEVLCDDRTCAKIGDAIIAIDSGDVQLLGANNDSEWIPISQAIGKQLVNPIRILK